MSVSNTVNAFEIGKDWIAIDALLGGVQTNNLILQNCGRPGDIIELAILDTMPTDTFHGFRLDQIKALYNVPANAIAWVRFVRNEPHDIGLKTCKLQISEPLSLSSDSSALTIRENPVGGYIAAVSSERSYVVDALRGSVYTASGAFTITTGQIYAMVFTLPKSLIVRKLKALSSGSVDVDITAYNQAATGTPISPISFVNTNECVVNTTDITAQFIGPDAVVAGETLDWCVNDFKDPIIIGCEGLQMSIVFNTRDMAAGESVRWLLTFEQLEVKPGAFEPLLRLEADTLLLADTEMSIYN